MSTADLANPHALATIVEASAKRTIVASQDILDERGVKLWSRDQPVSESLQQRLLERKLKQPLEACLRASDGVTPFELHEALKAFFESDHAISRALKPWSGTILDEVKHVPLHSVPQLLLTAAQASKPQVFEHAVRGMALAGAMSASTRADKYQLRLALLGGLLHDLGEMYVDPQYLDTKQPLDAQGYRHLAVHPKVGAMLLTRLTDYPAALTRAITEHHERGDGSGYPARLMSDGLSPMGKLLSVMETTLGIASYSKAPWTHASFALRMIPGEYDGAWISFVAEAARQAQEDLSVVTNNGAGGNGGNLGDQLAAVNKRLDDAEQQASDIHTAAASDTVKRISERAVHLLRRLRTGWNAMGMWAIADADAPVEARFEWTMACRELAYRLRFIRRECLWAEGELPPDDGLVLEMLWSCLEQPLV
jgi:hypothetical protein